MFSGGAKPKPVEKVGVKKDDAPADVSKLTQMFEKKATVKLDQDKKKFLTGNDKPVEAVNNPFTKAQPVEKKVEPPKPVVDTRPVFKPSASA